MKLNLVYRDSSASKCLDFLRFFSAFTVVVYHEAVVLDVSTGHFIHNSPFRYALWYVIWNWRQHGYQFVMVFFVLSGYFISGSVLKLISENRWSWKDYLISRVTRLWIVLVPALIFTAIWYYVDLRIFSKPFYMPTYIGLKTLLENLFFLQYTHGIPVYGHNGPLWSLSYEFWYYILFPCIVMTIKSTKGFERVFFTLLSVSILYFVGKNIDEYFLIWLLGCLVAVLRPLRVNNLSARLCLFGLAIFLFIKSLSWLYLVQFQPPSWISKIVIADFSVGAAFAFLIYLIVSFLNNKKQSHFKKWSITTSLAAFSYTLYLTHYPLLDFLGLWDASERWPLHTRSFFLLFIPVTIAICIYSWAISKFSEAKTDQVRKFVRGKFKRSTPIGVVHLDS